MALCICAGLTGNTGEVSVWASEGSSSDAVRIGALKGPTAMGMAQLLDEDGYDFTIAASPDEIVPMVVQDKLDIAAVPANGSGHSRAPRDSCRLGQIECSSRKHLPKSAAEAHRTECPSCQCCTAARSHATQSQWFCLVLC